MPDNPLLSSQDSRWGRPNPFVTTDGKNPFADEGAPTELPPADNPYASSAASNVPAHIQGGFVTTQASRGNLLLIFTALAWLGLALTGLAVALQSSWAYPPALLAWVPAITGWALAWRDLVAQHAGAMDSKGRLKTLAAYWLSLLAVLALCVIVGLWLVYGYEPGDE